MRAFGLYLVFSLSAYAMLPQTARAQHDFGHDNPRPRDLAGVQAASYPGQVSGPSAGHTADHREVGGGGATKTATPATAGVQSRSSGSVGFIEAAKQVVEDSKSLRDIKTGATIAAAAAGAAMGNPASVSVALSATAQSIQRAVDDFKAMAEKEAGKARQAKEKIETDLAEAAKNAMGLPNIFAVAPPAPPVTRTPIRPTGGMGSPGSRAQTQMGAIQQQMREQRSMAGGVGGSRDSGSRESSAGDRGSRDRSGPDRAGREQSGNPRL